jgi:hypothetical protein
MSPWTALLQSLHSALIDEVTDRHPEPKPELGLPKRQSRFDFPSALTKKILVVDVSIPTSDGASEGFAMLGFQPEFLNAAQLKAPELWSAMLKRAQSDFSRRNISPIFGKPSELKSSADASKELLALKQIVWIPISVPQGECWFGIAKR